MLALRAQCCRSGDVLPSAAARQYEERLSTAMR